MTEIEAVARAICSATHPGKDPDGLVPFPRGRVGQGPRWEVYSAKAAQAAILALDNAREGVQRGAAVRSHAEDNDS